MSHHQRRIILFIALAAVVGWSGWLALNDDALPNAEEADLVAPVAAPARHPSPASKPTTVPSAQAARVEAEPRLALSRTNLFPEQTWYVAPPPPPPQPYIPPPPPQAPPLPYSYMGRWQEDGETIYYLARGALPVSARPGQVLDGVWKLETAGNGSLNFMYLPLNQTRSLRTGE